MASDTKFIPSSFLVPLVLSSVFPCLTNIATSSNPISKQNESIFRVEAFYASVVSEGTEKE